MKKRRLKKRPIAILIIIILLLIGLLVFLFYQIKVDNKKQKIKEEKETINEITKHYNEYVKTHEKVKIYDKKENVIGEVSNVVLKLKKEKVNKNTKYFYAENIKAYISYKDVDKTEKIDSESNKYIPFNIEITTNKKSTIFLDENSYYKFDKEMKFNPVMIDENKYFFIYDGKMVYINGEDVKEKKETETLKSASSISVINYHYIISEEEKKDCKDGNCILEESYDEQMKYLKDNDYYTATMKDLELWIDKKINLPEKTVVITIDDGWFVQRNIQILEKYNLHATLFLIGHLASPDAYQSPSLEIHSHTWNMHNLGECPIMRGGAILCKDKNYILNDLKKSRESLNGSEYFAYPFYEYNDYAIAALKEAGFKMAFAGGARKATQGIDKYKVPRFGITNRDTLNSFIKIIN